MAEIGSLINGKYRVLRVAGKGGMSVVYQAADEKENKIWGIKEVRRDSVPNFESVRQNMIGQAALLKQLDHPNLPKIIDVIDTDDAIWIVMDYIEGNTLLRAIEEKGAQDQDDVVDWAMQLCDVLGYLHSRVPPIIYRDIKPSNVMLRPDGSIALIDLGSARVFNASGTGDASWLGTMGYAAPEQYGGLGQTDARTDIYCLGAVMYHLVTGHNPSKPPYEMVPIRQWEPSLSSGLEKIILKCTQRDPNARYGSCAELMFDLERYRELDDEYLRARDYHWKMFLVCVIIAIVAAVSALGFKIGENSMMSPAYEVTAAQDSIEEAYHMMRIGFYVCLTVAALFFSVGAVMFFRFDIRAILSARSEKTKAKAVREMAEENRTTGKFPRRKPTAPRRSGASPAKGGAVQTPDALAAGAADDFVESYARRAAAGDDRRESFDADSPTVRLDAVDSALLVQSATIPEVEGVRFEIVRKTILTAAAERIE